MKLLHSLPACLLLLTAACGATRTNAVVTGKPQPPTRGDVKVVMDGAPVPDGVEEIAIVQALGQGTHADLAHVIEGLKAESAKHGCDMVVRVKVDQGAGTASANGVCVRTAAASVP